MYARIDFWADVYTNTHFMGKHKFNIAHACPVEPKTHDPIGAHR